MIFVCGNGGSSSTAEHFTNDLFSKGVRAMCLNSNTAIMTMIANDFGYEFVFSDQLELYAEEGDELVVFSCSGTSPNIVNAIETAEEMGMDVIELFGKEGKSYEDIENDHLRAAHTIANEI